MNNKLRIAIVGMFILMLSLVACTDTQMAHLSAFGNSATIVCYSGTLKIYDGKSTGKVQNAEHSDGYEFMDASDNKLTQVSGNCIVKY